MVCMACVGYSLYGLCWWFSDWCWLWFVWPVLVLQMTGVSCLQAMSYQQMQQQTSLAEIWPMHCEARFVKHYAWEFCTSMPFPTLCYYVCVGVCVYVS